MKAFAFFLGLSIAMSAATGWGEPAPEKAGGKEAKDKEVKNERVDKLFTELRDGKYRGVTFPTLDWNDIPALLKRADSDKKLASIPANPFSSYAQRECSEGMAALWLVEGIRKGGKYPSLNVLCNAIGGPHGDKASDANREQVAKAYRDWWEKARTQTPDKARQTNPLEGTDLYWR